MLDNRSQSYQSYELGHGAYGMRYGHLREVVIEKPHRKFCGLQTGSTNEKVPKESYPDTNEYFALLNDSMNCTAHHCTVAWCKTATECSAPEAFQLQCQ